MPQPVNITEFLAAAETHPVIDVRTPAEFEQGHIVGAINIPLFSNEERVIIGTLYKQEGKQAAILKGLELVGPKLHLFIEQARNTQNSGTFLMHCWRGGMRSASMAWLFEAYGFKCITLRGGYKAYRKHVLQSFSQLKKFIVLGGKTGSGKTLILQALRSQGEQIIDLENIAHHKGSSFGSLGERKQSSQEQFENELYTEYAKTDAEKICWIENESRKIGVNVIPDKLWEQMRAAKVAVVNLPVEERINYLVTEYGKYSKDELTAAMERITRHLGGQHAKAAIQAILDDDLAEACRISLVYYDKTYQYGEDQREKSQLIHFEFEKLTPENIAETLRKKINNND
jgi:tRNA 2-selenouridine synthase